MISIATDYVADSGDPSPYLRRIADAGFSHVHWCHHWCSDFTYFEPEIAQIKKRVAEYGLKVLDMHASSGVEKCWWSKKEHERLAGVELVRNRIDMVARLGGDAVVMHIPNEPAPEPLRRSLDELEAFTRERSIRIAVENGWENMKAIEWVLANYPPDYVGMCYDSGHGTIAGDGPEWLDTIKDRIVCIHLDDNVGENDLHNPLFSGTTDWERLAVVLATSSYAKCVNMEINMPNSGIDDEAEFLRVAFETGTRFARMIDEARKSA